MEFELRPVAVADEAFLLGLYASTREEELAIVPWSQEQKDQFIGMQFEAQRADYSSRFPEAIHSVVVVDNRDVGRVWIDGRHDEIRLLDIIISPEYQSTGIGSAIIARLQEEAAAASVALRHSVHATNENALRFYRSRGFEVIEDFQTHLLMEWIPSPTE